MKKEVYAYVRCVQFMITSTLVDAIVIFMVFFFLQPEFKIIAS
jgi:hypothetical protein